MSSNKIIFVDINKIDNDLWGSRSYKNQKTREKIDKRIDELAENISREGQYSPITIAIPKTNGHYSVVDGRLRLSAHQKIGLKKIKCIFTEETDKGKLADMSFYQNYQRENLTLDDELFRFKSLIVQNGYTLREAITYCKSLHNSTTKGTLADNKTVPEKFKKLLTIVPKIGYLKNLKTKKKEEDTTNSYNYLYQILTTMEYLDKEVQDLCEEYNISMGKRILLTNTILRKYPEVQKILVAEMFGLSLDRSKIIVLQKIRDIETGALIKTDEESYTVDFDKREKVSTRIHPVKNGVMKYLDILDNINDLMYTLTGHKRLGGEPEYTQEHIDFSEPYRIEIMKGLAPQQRSRLFKDLTLVSDALDSFIDILENEQQGGNKEKKDVIKYE